MMNNSIALEATKFCYLLPKIELHAHLNGSISLETLQNLKSRCPTDELDNFQITSSTPLKKCFELFDIVYKIIDNPEKVYGATVKVIEEFYNDNVIYLELRSTPRKNDLMTKDEYIASIIKAIEFSALKYTDCRVKLLISVNRARGIEEAEENIELAIKYHKLYPNYVVGLDLSGDPTEGDAFLHLLQKARNSGLKIAAHCAEVPNNKEVEDILNFKPDRLGHCTHIHPDLKGSKELFDKLLKLKIPVELCLTSNIKCETVPNYSKHQFNYFYQANHPICIATDDKSVFNTSLSKEFEILQSNFKLSSQDLIKLSLDTIDYSFATEEEKQILRDRFEKFNKM